MALHTYRVTVVSRKCVDVTLDDSLIPDDEWRSQFHNIRTLEEVAEVFGRCYVLFGRRPERLDGFYGVEAAKEVKLQEVWAEEDEEVSAQEVETG